MPKRDAKGRHPLGGRDFDTIVITLAGRLRTLRAARGWTQRAAAERIGVGAPVLRRLENGKTNPSLAVLMSVARAFGVSLKRLLGR